MHFLLTCISYSGNNRILMNRDGSPVYGSEEEFNYYQKMFDELQDIMELVGFTQEVSLLVQYWSL